MKVSILIPVYNAATYLEKTLQSALDQTWPETEIIVVDDGSTDESLAIARSFKSHRLQVVSQNNSGACAARNRAFAEAQGDLIQFLDADDFLSPEKISSQVKLFQQYGTDIISSSKLTFLYDDQFAGKKSVSKNFLERDWDNPMDWLVHSWNGAGMNQTSIWLTPRHIIEKAGPWDERLLVNQDGEYFCRVLLQARSIKFSKDAVVFYRAGNTSSISGRLSLEKAKSRLLSYQIIEQQALAIENSERVKYALMNNYLFFLYFHYDYFPELRTAAMEQIERFGLTIRSAPGGKNFSYLTRTVGFYNALKLRSMARAILR